MIAHPHTNTALQAIVETYVELRAIQENRQRITKQFIAECVEELTMERKEKVK